MNELVWIRSHVERCLEDLWELPRVEMDDDGDYPFRTATARGFVRLEPGEPPVIRVSAQAVLGARRTARLLVELNDVNRRSRTAHVFLVDGIVIVEQALHVAGVDRDTLGQACSSVAAVADDIGAMIAAVHGGQTPFPVGDEPADREAG